MSSQNESAGHSNYLWASWGAGDGPLRSGHASSFSNVGLRTHSSELFPGDADAEPPAYSNPELEDLNTLNGEGAGLRPASDFGTAVSDLLRWKAE